MTLNTRPINQVAGLTRHDSRQWRGVEKFRDGQREVQNPETSMTPRPKMGACMGLPFQEVGVPCLRYPGGDARKARTALQRFFIRSASENVPRMNGIGKAKVTLFYSKAVRIFLLSQILIFRRAVATRS